MSTTFHPRDRLSAYLDDALSLADRAVVEAHLAGCPDCQARLAELRDVAALVASLPVPSPSRRLTPRFKTVPAWIAPLRTLATLASGVSVFLFMASAILANIGHLSQGAATDSLTTGAAAVAPAAPGASGAASAAARDSATASQGAAKQPSSPAPSGHIAFATSTAPAAAAGRTAAPEVAATSIRIGPSPWVWLLLAIATGAIALALQRRLRSA